MSTREPRRNKQEEKKPSNPKSTPSESTTSQPAPSKTKSSDDIDDWLEDFDPSSTSQKSEIQEKAEDTTEEETEKSSNQEVAVDTILEQFVRQLPGWINKPWMYVKPTHEGHLQNWYQSWRDLILKYTRMFSEHIVSVYDLNEVHPFSHNSSGKNLSIEQVQYLIDEMVDESLAKWLDHDNLRARIYYTTDPEWAEIIYDYMVDTGYVLDIMTLYELRNLDQKWSTLPDNELRIVLDILVKEDKAEWIGKEKDTLQFKLQ